MSNKTDVLVLYTEFEKTLAFMWSEMDQALDQEKCAPFQTPEPEYNEDLITRLAQIRRTAIDLIMICDATGAHFGEPDLADIPF